MVAVLKKCDEKNVISKVLYAVEKKKQNIRYFDVD